MVLWLSAQRQQVVRAIHSIPPCKMLVSAVYSLVLFIAIASCGETETKENPGQSFLAYDFLYNEGVKNYLEDNWEGCVKNFELALQGWHLWNDNTAR